MCGAAARTRQTQLVPDVHAFPGHIACASSTLVGGRMGTWSLGQRELRRRTCTCEACDAQELLCLPHSVCSRRSLCLWSRPTAVCWLCLMSTQVPAAQHPLHVCMCMPPQQLRMHQVRQRACAVGCSLAALQTCRRHSQPWMRSSCSGCAGHWGRGSGRPGCDCSLQRWRLVPSVLYQDFCSLFVCTSV